MSRNKIVYGQWTFEDRQIQHASLYLSTSLLSDSLEANTFSADVTCPDRSILDFERNTPLVYSRAGRQLGIFYVQDITRIGPASYTISATSAIGMLVEGLHYGGIYSGETVAELLPGICGSVPYEIKGNLQNIALYGWLPAASPRDNLSQVLFAIGATVKTDLDGVLRIEGLWDGVSGSIGENRLYQGQRVEYAAKVTRVVVTEHQYIEGTEETEVFSGTAQAGDVITFSEPLHSLSATGFTITESGANYAVLSAGTGVLSGKSYIHNTRQVSRDVSQSSTENVVTVEDATLVSLVNSVSVAERLAAYYACRETISGDILLDRQTPGDVVTAFHPYDQETVQACIESLDIRVSNTLRATATELVGFHPPQNVDTQYYDYREEITENGNWTVPDGVTSIAGVLISGGWGGWSGLYGQPDESGGTPSSGSIKCVNNRVAGDGGAGGEGGSGGKILQFNADVTPGETFACVIGPGGAGGTPSASGSVQGAEGGATTFGSYSSANGSESPNGYTDIITGTVYAKSGLAGIAGGRGVGGDPALSGEPSIKFIAGTPVTGRDGTVYSPLPAPEINNPGLQSGSQSNGYAPDGDYVYVEGYAQIGGPGGAAVGGSGSAGSIGSVSLRPSASNAVRGTVQGGKGGAGQNALPPAKQQQRGCGGDGGNGGGGAGGGGGAYTVEETTGIGANYSNRYAGDSGDRGAGSRGGVGGDGIIILYYRRPVLVTSGAIMGADNKIRLDKLGRLMVG